MVSIELGKNKIKTNLQQRLSATDNIIIKFLNAIYKSAVDWKFLNQKRTGPWWYEGDSWFPFSKPGVRDTLDYIMDKFRLLSWPKLV
jgi:hypothetical protein